MHETKVRTNRPQARPEPLGLRMEPPLRQSRRATRWQVGRSSRRGSEAEAVVPVRALRGLDSAQALGALLL